MTCLPNWPADETNDPALKLFGLSRPMLPPITPGGRVLEVGYRDTPWSAWCKRSDPSLDVTAIDWRARGKWLPGVTCVRGDILAQDYPRQSWDVVVGLSSFEHIGLGHYELDPLYDDGDVTLVRKVREWLKPGGWCYFDVPHRPEGYHVEGSKYRAYNDAALLERFGTVDVLGYTTASVNGWINKPTSAPTNGKPYYYVACLIRA